MCDQQMAFGMCDCMQWGVYVPVFRTYVIQAAGSCRI